MKKIILGHGLEQVSAICNFCEEDKMCVRGTLKKTIEYPNYEYVGAYTSDEYTYGYAIKNYEPTIFGRKKIIGEPEYKMLPKGELSYNCYYKKLDTTSSEEDYADICTDCVMQLSKLLK